MSYDYLCDYAKLDAEFSAHALVAEHNYVTQVSNAVNWLDAKREKAELEAHRERVRQVYARAFSATSKSAEWAQGLVYIQNATTVDALKKVCDSFDIVWSEKGDMLTKNEQIEQLKHELKKTQAKLEKLEYGRWGKEPANGTVYKIERRYERLGQGYTFAAVRAAGAWYITGTKSESSQAYTWAGLQAWAGKYSRVWKMTVSEELVD